MTSVLFVARLGLALVFAVAGVAKVADRAGTRAALQGFGVPRRLAPWVALGLPVAELGIAGSLVPSAAARAGAAAAAGLLAVLSLAIGIALARGRRPSCGCFGRASAPIGPATLIRNTGLAAVAGAVAVAGPGTALTAVHVDPVWAAIAALGLVVTLLMAITYQLVRQNGRLIERLRVVEEAHGEPAPAVETSEGPLEQLVGEGSPVALVFSQTGCGACSELAPRLERLRAQRAGSLRIALVHDNPAAVRDYGVEIVPSAILVDRNGRIGSGLAAGALAVERFLAAASN